MPVPGQRMRKKVINGDVDESLFASTSKPNSARSSAASSARTSNRTTATQQQPASNAGPKQYFKSGISGLGRTAASTHGSTALLDQATLNNLYKLTGEDTMHGLHSKTSILSSYDVAEMKEQVADPQQARLRQTHQQSYKQELAQAYRQRIVQAEAQRQQHVEESESERQQAAANALLLQYAKAKLDENDDDVKSMNTMINYAKVVSIRDTQILEKRRLQEEQMLEEKRLDDAMEVERLRAMKALEDRDRIRRQEQRLGAQVISQQIAEREQERLMQQEHRELESQQMLEAVRRQAAAEEAEKQAKVEAGRQLLREVAATNAAQSNAKLERKLQDIEEDRRISEYIRAKEQREREMELQSQALKAEKEREITRLRAMQERVADRQAAIDELRAKRYQEAKDREYRLQIESESQKRDRTKQEIQQARHQQEVDRQRVLSDEAEAERDLYLRNLQHLTKQSDDDAEKLLQLKANANYHRQQLQQQILERQQRKQHQQQQYRAEGDALAKQIQFETERLNALKQQRLTELSECGINQLYLTELRKHKVLNASIHK